MTTACRTFCSNAEPASKRARSATSAMPRQSCALPDGASLPARPPGLISCSGEDAQAFLHGQLSNDVKQLTPERSEYAATALPKAHAGQFLLCGKTRLIACSSRVPVAGVQKRLAMFVLRAKVKLAMRASRARSSVWPQRRRGHCGIISATPATRTRARP